MSDVRVHVERSRPTCPFCKDEVASGHVWVCPGCEAAHHAACHDEHGACASCALAGPHEGASAATKGDAPAGEDPGGLASRRRELERLGFKVVVDAQDELVAIHSRWRFGWLVTPSAYAVFVRRAPHLTLARLQGDLAALRTNPLTSRNTILVYLAERVDVDARRFVADGQGLAHLPLELRVFPVIREGESGTGTFFTGTRPFEFVVFPGLRYLARRLLFPWLSPDATNEQPLVPPALLLTIILILIASSVAVVMTAAR